MRGLKVIALRFRSLFRQSEADRSLEAELQFHLDQQIQENLEAGMRPTEARAAAIRALGGREQIAEACRDARGVRLVQDLARDAVYACRVLRKTPAFTSIAVLTLALGIGATTAIFSVVNGVLLRPLDYRDSGRIVSLGTRSRDTGRETSRLTGGDLLDLRELGGTFEAISAYWGGEIGVQVAGRGEFLGVYFVEPSFFRVFGVTPVRGRMFVARDGEECAVLGEGFAERAFGSAARALGQSVSVEGHRYQVVGVMPRSFTAPERTDLWVPIPMPLPRIALNRTAFNFHAVARIADGVSLGQAEVRVGALGDRMRRLNPSIALKFTTLDAMVAGSIDTQRFCAWLVGLFAGLALLLAAAGVYGVMAYATAQRAAEFGVRVALGATRTQVFRAVMSNAGRLAAAGLAVGALLSLASGRLIASMLFGVTALDGATYAGTIGLLLAVVLLGAAVPAWQASRVDPLTALRQD